MRQGGKPWPCQTINKDKNQARSLTCTLAASPGVLIGQAISIQEWEFRDGTRGGPIAEANAIDERQAKAPSAEDVAEAGQ